MARGADIKLESTEGFYPLSPMQQGMLFHSLRGRGGGVDISQIIMELPEEVDAGVLEQAWQRLAERHAVLRTSFRWEGLDEPRQEVHRQIKIPFVQRDWEGLAPSEQAARFETLLEEERRQGFEPAIAPLMRLALIRKGPADFQLVWSYHHILLDARSLAVLLKELFVIYEGLRDGDAPVLPRPLPYRNYIEWLQQQDWSEAEKFWRQNLKGFTAPTLLMAASVPVEEMRAQPKGGLPVACEGGDGSTATREDAGPAIQPGSRPGSLGEQEIEISAAVTSALRSAAKKNGLTLNTFVQGAWGLLLSRYSNEEEVVFGAVRACRRSTVEGAESMAGLLINTLPVRVRVAPEMGLLPWLKEIRKQWTELREFEHTPLVKIQGWSEAPGGTPLFESIINLQDPSWDAELQAQGGKWARRKCRTRSQPGYPLALDVYGGQTLAAKIFYNRERFDENAIARLLGHWQILLEGMAAHPEWSLSSFPLLTKAERDQLLVEWNQTEADYPKEQCIQQLFEAQTERTPDALAVSGAQQQLSYRELNERANQLAHQLQELGIGPDVPAGICADRSVEMVVGQLAILKAGGAYVPIDPAYPKERIRFMLEDAGISVLLSRPEFSAELPGTLKMIGLDEVMRCPFDPQRSKNPASRASPKNLAYVIYTSGSTGQPKGVAVEHASLVNLVAWHQRTYLLRPEDRATQLAGPAFDASVWELWPYLTAGASVHIPEAATRLAPKALLEWLAAEKITLCFLPTPLAEAVLEEPWPKEMALRALLTGGDRLHRRPSIPLPCPLVNHYGPTECTVVTTAGVVAPGPQSATPSIGRPIANTQVYILDHDLRPAPIGVPGELHIGGAGLARGYLNHLERTAEKFIPNPFSRHPQARLYKTGDRARYLPDGAIEFLGRIDQQVKIRGQRMEPGEIESAICQHSNVREAAVIAVEDRAGGKRLAAYVVGGREPAPDTEELREFLKQKLPEYMVPTAFVVMEALPLTAHGKVDRKALAGLEPDPTWEKAFLAPRTPTEEMLAGIWSQLLHLPQVGAHDNFFQLGGHSLLATQVIARVRSAFPVELAVQALFDAPTVAALAEKIDADRRRDRELSGAGIQAASGASNPEGGKLSAEGWGGKLQARPTRDGEVPLSFAQERLWFLEQVEPGQAFNNIPTAIRLRGELHPAALEESLREIVRRHEVFRTAFSNRQGRPSAILSGAEDSSLPAIDLSRLPAAEREAEARRLAEAEARQPFDLSRGQLLRAKLIQLTTRDHLLLLTTHHIVSDGWSMGILYRELGVLYEALVDGRPAPLPELPIQYADFAHWQRQWVRGEVLDKQLAYWKEQLKGRLGPLDLPADRPRPPLQTYHGATHFFTLRSSLHGALKKLSRREDVTLFMLLLAAFQTLLHRYSGQENIVVGSAIAGRTRAETENLIGLFLNTLVLRTDLSGDPTFRELLQRVRKVALEAYAHQDVPFEKLVEALPVERDLSRSPLFQVMFVLQNAPVQAVELAGLSLTPVPMGNGAAKFDLTLFLEEHRDGLSGSVEYNTDLFDSATILRLLGHFETLLEGIVENPNQPLSLAPILTEGERRQLLVEWNDTRADYPSEKCVHQLFEEQVERTPEAVAAVFEDEQLTYRELNQRANRLAHHLQSLGVGPEARVGICLRRSLEMLVGLLGILKAGGCYLPLDPAYPRERLAFMVADAQAPVLLSDEKLAEGFSRPGIKVVRLSALHLSAPHGPAATNPGSGVTPDNLAYVIYTSGSTGKPKGVMIRHRNVANFFAGMDERVGSDPGVWLAVTSISFDISVLELFWTLARGFKVILQGEEGGVRAVEKQARRPDRKMDFSLGEQLVRHGVTHLQCTPSLAGMLIQDPQTLNALRSLRKLLLGGEALPASLLKQLDISGQILNMYGPTETTVWSAAHQVTEAQGSIPIGRPIANTEIYILDRRLQPVPVGIPGELLIGGAGVVRGYLNRPELTAERFIAHPFSNRPGARLYRTGDLARYLPDGKIEFLGRLDQQVKMRGFRIELGEIESALCEHPLVREGVVVLREFSPGDKRLVAYLVAQRVTEASARGSQDAAPPKLNVAEVRNYLKEKLPDYMVPAAFEILDQLPLTPNGKVDRQALPAPSGIRGAQATAYVPLQTEVEKRIAAIWRKLLQVERIGLHDNFFDLGGHSLLVVQVHAQLCEAFAAELSIIKLFQYPTISSLAKFLNEEQKEKVSFPKIRERARRQKGAFGGQRQANEVPS